MYGESKSDARRFVGPRMRFLYELASVSAESFAATLRPEPAQFRAIPSSIKRQHTGFLTPLLLGPHGRFPYDGISGVATGAHAHGLSRTWRARRFPYSRKVRIGTRVPNPWKTFEALPPRGYFIARCILLVVARSELPESFGNPRDVVPKLMHFFKRGADLHLGEFKGGTKIIDRIKQIPQGARIIGVLLYGTLHLVPIDTCRGTQRDEPAHDFAPTDKYGNQQPAHRAHDLDAVLCPIVLNFLIVPCHDCSNAVGNMGWNRFQFRLIWFSIRWSRGSGQKLRIRKPFAPLDRAAKDDQMFPACQRRTETFRRNGLDGARFIQLK